MKNSLLLKKLNHGGILDTNEYLSLLRPEKEDVDLARELAQTKKSEFYGNRIFLRALIEFSNYCRNGCRYCGISRSCRIGRYRLREDDILEAVGAAHSLGYRSFVLQSGEDPFYDSGLMESLIKSIKSGYPDSALTLSIGEKTYEQYKSYKRLGVDRYLLRHETADSEHYKLLHPPDMSMENRFKCIMYLKKLGYQTGCGMMIGSPYQSAECIAKDLKFISDTRPEMVGIGPFISAKGTDFEYFSSGDAEYTKYIISLSRLSSPKSMIPSTTALASLDTENGYLDGINYGANVIMLNFTPLEYRANYKLYENKAGSGEGTEKTLSELCRNSERAGYRIEQSRGDHIDFMKGSD